MVYLREMISIICLLFFSITFLSSDVIARQDNIMADSWLSQKCNSEVIIFCEDFEGGISNWLTDNGDVNLVKDAKKLDTSNTILELRTYQGRNSSKLIRAFDDQELVYVRYEVRYALDYVNEGGSHGPVLGGAVNPPWGLLGKAGIKPSGHDHFTLNYEPIGIIGKGGEFGLYAYYVNMRPTNSGKYWGVVYKTNHPGKAVITPGEWHCVEYGLRLNTQDDSRDGMAWFWFNGLLVGAVSGIQWRIDTSFGINTFVLDSYNHFRTRVKSKASPNRVQYDNIVVSRLPVGCEESEK